MPKLCRQPEKKNFKRVEKTSAFTEVFIKYIPIYHPNIHANISGQTIVASLSTINLGVLISNFPQVIFSLGTAPE